MPAKIAEWQANTRDFLGVERRMLSEWLLTELTVARLEADGVKVYWHQRVPPSDGGIALVQVVAASRQFKFEETRGSTNVFSSAGKDRQR